MRIFVIIGLCILLMLLVGCSHKMVFDEENIRNCQGYCEMNGFQYREAISEIKTVECVCYQILGKQGVDIIPMR